MKTCENCGNEHDGTYKSGRFCSSKCRYGFSTKVKRKEINKKVSLKITANSHDNVKIICKYCGKEFEAFWVKRYQKYCSHSCSGKDISSYSREKLSKQRINKLLNGVENRFGIKCMYKFKDIDIKCDSKIEYTCLNFFETIKNATSMKRCNFSIEYDDNGLTRRYIPDFIIESENKIYIVECKSQIVSESLNIKWHDYIRKSSLKKEALEKFCVKNGYESFWFTKDLHSAYYKNVHVA